MCTRLPLSSCGLCCGNSHLSHQRSCRTVRRKLITSATKSASAGTADAVQAEFARAGIPTKVTQKLLKQYKYYLNWDIETKLRPLQELGAEQLSQQLQRLPRLLVCKPEDCNDVYLWLTSKGVNAARVQQKAPGGMMREIRAVPLRLSSKQLPSRIHRFVRFSTSTLQLLQMDQNMFSGRFRLSVCCWACRRLQLSFRHFIMAAHDRLFLQSPDTLHQRVTFFCQMYATGTHVTRTAIKMGVFATPEPVMQSRAAKLQELLGWDSEQLMQKLSAFPKLLNSEPSTIACNVHAMQGAGFSPTQVWAMCTKQPSLLGRKWTSDTNVEKLQILTCLLDLTLDNIATNPILLNCSAERHLGPRVWFLLQSGAIDAPNNIMTSGSFSWISGGSKAGFSVKFSQET